MWRESQMTDFLWMKPHFFFFCYFICVYILLVIFLLDGVQFSSDWKKNKRKTPDIIITERNSTVECHRPETAAAAAAIFWHRSAVFRYLLLNNMSCTKQ